MAARRSSGRQRSRRSTPAGEHRPVMLDTVLEVLAPQPGEIAVDCTLGFAGHAQALLERVGPDGRLVGIDVDPENLARAQGILEATGKPFSLHHSNFAALPNIVGAEGLAGVHLILADLGMSSMQVDDPERGFSYVRDGPLDMRMDRSRGRTAGEMLASISEDELARALREFGDEIQAGPIAAALVTAARRGELQRTADVCRVIFEATGKASSRETGWRLRPGRNQWDLHPAARTFQALRILVNRELANLQQLLRIVPQILLLGGRVAIISFHSGEDRLVKSAFRRDHQAGMYQAISAEPLRAAPAERWANPRSRSAKLRWARRSNEGSASIHKS